MPTEPEPTPSLQGRVFLDTNVIVYAYDDADPAKRDRARAVLADESIEAIISTQVLSEFYVTVTRKLDPGLTPSVAASIVEQLGELHVVPVTRNLVIDAVRSMATVQLSYWDALIVTAASAGGAGIVATEDLHPGTEISGVTIVNPFA